MNGNKRGAILIITLWILTFLSTITLSLAYRMKIELKLIKSEINKAQMFPIVQAGIKQAILVLKNDSNAFDGLNEQWSNHTVQNYYYNPFKQIKVGTGKFTVSYPYSRNVFSGTSYTFYGVEDEERRININNATQDMLESIPGITQEMAGSIRAWRGDSTLDPNTLFKEDTYYQGLSKPYKRKGQSFECIEELGLVRGLTMDKVFGKDLNEDGSVDTNEGGILRYITVFGDGLVNINTAGVTVLRAIGFTEDLTYSIIRYRGGDDEIIGTIDDRNFTNVGNIISSLSGLEPITPEEVNLITSKQSLLKVSSDFYAAHIQASSSDETNYYVTAIVNKKAPEGSEIVQWIE